MAETGLFALYKLHLIDSALYEMKTRAASLDVGRGEAEEIKKLEADPEGTLAASRALSSELKDLELEQKSLEDKLKKLDSDLYGGKVVNPREVENIELEKTHVKDHISRNDARILELWELVPPAKEKASGLEGQISQLKGEIVKKQTAAKEEHARLQAAYKAEAAKRPAALKAVPEPLLTLYEKLREKLGVGMAMVTDAHRCDTCGLPVAEKPFDAVVHDKVVQCEGCRRILFRLQQG
ncbi:MAG: hypothetical protein JSS66_11690 [Armatimonadetes bacterium]|nr:hypothetical protein [Armatimonadota bacterium]